QLARQRERMGFLSVHQDFYHFAPAGGQNLRAYTVQFGPLRWRLFWSRIGNGLYVASKPFILEDLLALEADRGPTSHAAGDRGRAGHGLVRLRPRNWNQVLADYRLGWAENHRQACLHNHGPLASVARALAAGRAELSGDEATPELLRLASRLYGTH